MQFVLSRIYFSDFRILQNNYMHIRNKEGLFWIKNTISEHVEAEIKIKDFLSW